MSCDCQPSNRDPTLILSLPFGYHREAPGAPTRVASSRSVGHFLDFWIIYPASPLLALSSFSAQRHFTLLYASVSVHDGSPDSDPPCILLLTPTVLTLPPFCRRASTDIAFHASTTEMPVSTLTSSWIVCANGEQCRPPRTNAMGQCMLRLQVEVGGGRVAKSVASSRLSESQLAVGDAQGARPVVIGCAPSWFRYSYAQSKWRYPASAAHTTCTAACVGHPSIHTPLHGDARLVRPRVVWRAHDTSPILRHSYT